MQRYTKLGSPREFSVVRRTVFCVLLGRAGQKLHKTGFAARRSVGGPAEHNFKVKKVFCFKLGTMSVPEALETTIRILLMYFIVLAHRWNRGVWARPAPSGTPHRHPWEPLGTPRAPPRGPTVHKTRFAARQKSHAAKLVLCTFGPGQFGQISFRERKM